jgi:hypothetical protein
LPHRGPARSNRATVTQNPFRAAIPGGVIPEDQILDAVEAWTPQKRKAVLAELDAAGIPVLLIGNQRLRLKTQFDEFLAAKRAAALGVKGAEK